jgi:hypothetical protein
VGYGAGEDDARGIQLPITNCGEQNAMAYWPTIAQDAARWAISPALVAAVGIEESGFTNIQQRGGGAGVGVFQLTPGSVIYGETVTRINQSISKRTRARDSSGILKEFCVYAIILLMVGLIPARQTPLKQYGWRLLIWPKIGIRLV